MHIILLTKHLIVKTHRTLRHKESIIFIWDHRLQQYILIDTKSDRNLHCIKESLIVYICITYTFKYEETSTLRRLKCLPIFFSHSTYWNIMQFWAEMCRKWSSFHEGHMYLYILTITLQEKAARWAWINFYKILQF